MQDYLVRAGKVGPINNVPIKEKRWGSEQIIVDTDVYQVKRLMLRGNQETSMHYHERKHETVTVLKGKLVVFFESQSIGKVTLYPGDCLEILAGKDFAHRMSTKGTTEICCYFESAVAGCDDDNIRIRL